MAPPSQSLPHEEEGSRRGKPLAESRPFTAPEHDRRWLPVELRPLGERLSRVFSTYWRRDRFLPLSFVGLALVLVVRHHLESRPGESFPDFWSANKPVVVWGFIGLLLFAAGCVGRVPRLRGGISLRSPATLRPRVLPDWWKWSALGAGVVLFALGTALYVYTIHRVVTEPRGLLQITTLVGALVAWISACSLTECLRRKRSWVRDLGLGHQQEGLPAHRRDWPWLLLVIGGWLFVNQATLDRHPAAFHPDEAMIVAYGESTTRFPVGDLRNVPVWTTGMVPYAAGIPRKLMGEAFAGRAPYGPRAFSLLVGAGMLALLFVLARLWFGRLAAWLALVLAATSHIGLAFSRLAITVIDAPFLVLLFLLCFLAAWRSRRLSMGLLAGMVAGLCYYTYQAALICIPLGILLVVIEYIRGPNRLLVRWPTLVAMLFGFLLSAAPIKLFHGDHPDTLRFKATSVFLLSRANLERAFDETGTTTVPRLLVEQSWPAVGGLVFWTDRSNVYGYEGLPLFDRDTVVLLLLGLAASLHLWRRRRIFTVILAWIALTILLGSLMVVNPPPPSAARILVGLPAVYLLCGWVLGSLVVRVWRLFTWRLGILFLAAALLWTGVIAIRNVLHYETAVLVAPRPAPPGPSTPP